MAVIPFPVISHQDYCSYPSMRRLLRINEKKSDITHSIDFVLNEQLQLIAKVQHWQEVNSKEMPLVEVAEDKIYYVADRTQVDYDSGLPPTALPFPQLPNRDQIISSLRDKNVIVVDIKIDHLFYERLADRKTLNPNSNKTYILMAPAPQEPLSSLHFSPSASLTQDATPPESDSPTLRLRYELSSLEADLETIQKPAAPTAYQELSDL